jgi:hypothetical protein
MALPFHKGTKLAWQKCGIKEFKDFLQRFQQEGVAREGPVKPFELISALLRVVVQPLRNVEDRLSV